MNTTHSDDEVKKILSRSIDAIKCKQLFLLSQKLCEEKNIVMTDVQKLSLLYHLSAMVSRSLTNEKLEPIDRSIFSEISIDSLFIARTVKESLDNLEDDEIYLLSIHFETAKQNP